MLVPVPGAVVVVLVVVVVVEALTDDPPEGPVAGLVDVPLLALVWSGSFGGSDTVVVRPGGELTAPDAGVVSGTDGVPEWAGAVEIGTVLVTWWPAVPLRAAVTGVFAGLCDGGGLTTSFDGLGSGVTPEIVTVE